MSKFDKKKCKTCQYSSNFSSPESKERTICYYSVVSRKGACLKREGREIVDQRGNDPNHCLLYVKGPRLKPPGQY